jgi:hypothetical protein
MFTTLQQELTSAGKRQLETRRNQRGLGEGSCEPSPNRYKSQELSQKPTYSGNAQKHQKAFGASGQRHLRQ